MAKIRVDLMCCFYVFVLVLAGCISINSKTMMYEQAFEKILFEKGAYLEEIDYISIFINEEHVPERELAKIQQSLKKTYDKKVYTYKKEELVEPGPYGKENLKDEGVFLYITNIEKKGDVHYITAEKYYTTGHLSPVEILITY